MEVISFKEVCNQLYEGIKPYYLRLRVHLCSNVQLNYCLNCMAWKINAGLLIPWFGKIQLVRLHSACFAAGSQLT